MIHLEAFGRTPYRRAVRKEISSRPGPFISTPMGSRTAAGPRLKTNTHPPAYFFPFARTHLVFELVHSKTLFSQTLGRASQTPEHNGGVSLECDHTGIRLL